MIKIEKVETYGWEAAVRGMRNPMNSWDKSDSEAYWDGDNWDYGVGDEDLKLMKNLVAAGSDHGKFLRMIGVAADITAPLYWWKEYDTYKVGTVANSCSTMHKIHAKEFTLDDFSHEHVFNHLQCNYHGESTMKLLVEYLNKAREMFLQTNDKEWWWQMIQLLPASYNQKRTVTLNYQVLKNMYHARKNHKLDEWRIFCEWIETLPYSELITGGIQNG